MQSEILKRKPVINRNGEDVIDISATSIRYTKDNPTIINEVYVGNDMSMRGDLISKIAYGRTDYFDIILKFNGISNPYSVNTGDLIIIPELSFLIESLYNAKNDKEALDIINQYVDPSKKSEIDPKRIEYDESVKQMFKTVNAKFAKLPLPPNLAQPGAKEGKFINDTDILLGGDITGKTNG